MEWDPHPGSSGPVQYLWGRASSEFSSFVYFHPTRTTRENTEARISTLLLDASLEIPTGITFASRDNSQPRRGYIHVSSFSSFFVCQLQSNIVRNFFTLRAWPLRHFKRLVQMSTRYSTSLRLASFQNYLLPVGGFINEEAARLQARHVGDVCASVGERVSWIDRPSQLAWSSVMDVCSVIGDIRCKCRLYARSGRWKVLFLRDFTIHPRAPLFCPFDSNKTSWLSADSSSSSSSSWRASSRERLSRLQGLLDIFLFFFFYFWRGKVSGLAALLLIARTTDNFWKFWKTGTWKYI